VTFNINARQFMFLSMTDREFKVFYEFLIGPSILCFLICVLIFLSGVCITDHTLDNAKYERRQLQFISTQIGACLNDFPWVSWGFVIATQFQMLILYFSFLRLMYRRNRNEIPYHMKRDEVAVLSGVILITFVVSLASVVEFRSLSNSQLEQVSHYVAAIGTITCFFIFHMILSACVHELTKGQNEYNILKGVYFFLTVLFLFTWLVDTLFSSLTASAKLTEWLVFFSGISLHLYALVLIKHTSDNDSPTLRKRDETIEESAKDALEPFAQIVFSLFVGLVFTVVLALVLIRVVEARDLEFVSTGIEYWLIIISTYFFVACIIYSARHQV